jgi:hypothetical protein
MTRTIPAVIASVLLLIVGPQEKPKTQSKNAGKDIELKSSSSCVSFYGGGNASHLYATNMCNTSKEFDIQWSNGPVPPIVTKHRINSAPSNVRTINRQPGFLKAEIVADFPSKLGLGAHANADVRAHAIAGGGGHQGIYVINTRGNHTYVEYSILIKHSNGTTSTAKGNTGLELEPLGSAFDGSHSPVQAIFDGDSWVVETIFAETDTD